MLKDFRAFLLRGNVVDLAVAVVIGSAFTAVVNALVKDLITPLIAVIGGQPDFGGLKFTLGKTPFMYGDLLNQVLAFMIMASVVFFLVVQPVNHLIKLSRRKSNDAEESKDSQLLVLEEIRDALVKGRAKQSK